VANWNLIERSDEYFAESEAASPLRHMWSLAVEEQFYLVWPLLVFYLRRENLIRLCLALIAVSLVFRILLALDGQVLAAYVLTPARLDALATGALIALLATGRAGLRPWRQSAWFLAATAAALLAFIAAHERGLRTNDLVTITLGLTLLATLSGALVVLAVTSPASGKLARALSSRPLTALGRYSYGLYVLHHPIALGLRRILRIDDLPVVLGSSVPALIVYILVGGSISLAAAAISWHVIERHFLNLKERFRYRPIIGRRSSATAS
jgi:peptidoglycan/LPS O-acetylase OafA/YrhL